MLRGLESLAQARNLSLRFDEATAIVDDLVDACVEIKFQAPHAIDATSSPWPRRLDGAEAHEGPRNISQDDHSLVDFHAGVSGTITQPK